MDTVNLYDAKTNLSNLVERAARGEEIIIAKAGRPLARLVPLARRTTPRPLGLLAGQVTRPVLFAQAMAEAATGADLIVTAGPDAGLGARATECAEVRLDCSDFRRRIEADRQVAFGQFLRAKVADEGEAMLSRGTDVTGSTKE